MDRVSPSSRLRRAPARGLAARRRTRPRREAPRSATRVRRPAGSSGRCRKAPPGPGTSSRRPGSRTEGRKLFQSATKLKKKMSVATGDERWEAARAGRSAVRCSRRCVPLPANPAGARSRSKCRRGQCRTGRTRRAGGSRTRCRSAASSSAQEGGENERRRGAGRARRAGPRIAFRPGNLLKASPYPAGTQDGRDRRRAQAGARVLHPTSEDVILERVQCLPRRPDVVEVPTAGGLRVSSG